jgi:hypothetical protein
LFIVSLQVKNTINDGIAFPAFILGAGAVANCLFLTLEASKQENMHKGKLKE